MDDETVSTKGSNSLSALRMTSVLEERGEEIRSLQSDLQQKNSDISCESDFSTSKLLTHFQVCFKLL